VSGLATNVSYTFTVVATNAAGNSVASAASGSVIPRTVPSAPTNPVATAGFAQASVVFNTPGSDGGSTITEYTVRSSPGNFSATGPSSPLVVSGLATNVSYTFTVVATNAAGNSVASVASGSVSPFGIVFSAGKTWMDRNLGATRVATSSTDPDAYGDLYQWGRAADGHELRGSQTITTLSSSDQPGNDDFILERNFPYDWRSPQNPNLWQGVNGVNNNPCPSGFRLPTDAELDAERLSWTTNNSAGAFASPLKLPLAGYRSHMDGSLFGLGLSGYYWSSTVNSTYSRSLSFNTINASIASSDRRSEGNSVRCIMIN
jgi:uncharacterized protein (TIGR02145 family)